MQSWAAGICGSLANGQKIPLDKNDYKISCTSKPGLETIDFTFCHFDTLTTEASVIMTH